MLLLWLPVVCSKGGLKEIYGLYIIYIMYIILYSMWNFDVITL